jgi:aryl-alcohol dehydrogenase-like predicted oxidoreductase
MRGMQQRKLGNTGLWVSAVGLGCASFGGVGSAPAFFGMGESEPEAHKILDAALEMGITLYDTADAYGGGRSEAYLGSWLRAKGRSVRDQLVITTKVFNPVADGPNDRGLSRRHILRQVDASLQRLGCEWIDLYMMHEPDPATPIEETLGAMADAVRAGKVRYIGASNMPAWFMTKALWISDKRNWPRFEWIQNSYSLLDRADEREVLPLCADQKLGYTPFSPLAGGWLTGKYSSVSNFPKGSRMTLRPEPYVGLLNQRTLDGLKTFKALADARGVSMAGLALAWVMSHPLVTAPILGPRKPEHLHPAREALTLTLSPTERDAIAACFAGA